MPDVVITLTHKTKNGTTVSISYPVEFWHDAEVDIDGKINELASELGGTRIGSGAGFGMRDIDFAFKNGPVKARKFAQGINDRFKACDLSVNFAEMKS